MKGSIALILGTRPEIIKLSSLIRFFERSGQAYFILHTGQHYSYNMDQQFFEDLELPDPRYKFTRPASIGSNMNSELVRWISEECVKPVLKKERPAVVLVQGDTDTVVAGAMAARDLGGIAVGHVEAGLRSGDLNMPEERNRIQADRLSHYLFAPTQNAKRNLLLEHYDERSIEVTGNTVVDALFENLEIAKRREPKEHSDRAYALVTLHRPETVDNRTRLSNILQALEHLAENASLHIIVPTHPRTRQRMEEFGINWKEYKKIYFVDPMGYLDFIWYQSHAALVLTDSGGVQEEACILKVPCVTLRTTTERPETIDVGANIVAGYEVDRILSAAMLVMTRPKNWTNPFGDGQAAKRIAQRLEESQ